MSGSIFGKVFQISTWGESHGKALGVTIDGCPAGLLLSEEDIQKELNRRKPGQSAFTTKRSERDQVQILSGTFEGVTTGCPISLVVFNEDQRSHDYGNLSQVFRPGHADYTFYQKYGVRDYRGGGRSSGRETLSRVAAGAVAKKILEDLGIQVMAYTKSIGPITINPDCIKYTESLKNPLCMPDKDAYEKASAFLEHCIHMQDSVGGVVECEISGLPAGIGEPVFDKLDARLAQAIVSIGAVKGIEFGAGFAAATALGSENNDAFYMEENAVCKKSNAAGGVLGGISDGSTLVFRAAFKPTPSIAKPQHTVTVNGEDTEIIIKGRHDPIIVPRAVVVVEAMAAMTILDLLFEHMTSSMTNIRKFFQ